MGNSESRTVGQRDAQPTRECSVIRALQADDFFSFHSQDIVRVHRVENAWRIRNPNMSVLWQGRETEATGLRHSESIKREIQERVKAASVFFVLVGSDTWRRRWVRYEIACAVIYGKGLLAVRINELNDPETKDPGRRRPNPLNFLAVGKVQTNGRRVPGFYLFEWTAKEALGGRIQWSWNRYPDFRQPVSVPAWMPNPAGGGVTPLSLHTSEHDYYNDWDAENLNN